MTQAFDVPINAALNINQALGIAPGDFFPPRPYLIQNVGEGSLSSSLLYGDYPTAPDPCTLRGIRSAAINPRGWCWWITCRSTSGRPRWGGPVEWW